MSRTPTAMELCVARAAHNAFMVEDFDRLTPYGVEVWLQVARAAIRAMREITPEMRAAAERAMVAVQVTKNNIATTYWRSAIDAASPE